MADPLYCTWLLDAPCLKSEIWAAWAQALLSGVGIIAAAWLPNLAARREKKDRFYAVVALMFEASKRMYLIADLIALQKLPIGAGRLDEELAHLTAALDAIPAHELPEGALLYSIKGVRREVAAMNDLHRHVTSALFHADATWSGFSGAARESVEAMQRHMDQALELGDFRYGSVVYRARHRFKTWRKRRDRRRTATASVK
ncbi:hypothetical protein GGR77_001532 [Xanthomonas translucens]